MRLGGGLNRSGGLWEPKSSPNTRSGVPPTLTLRVEGWTQDTCCRPRKILNGLALGLRSFCPFFGARVRVGDNFGGRVSVQVRFGFGRGSGVGVPGRIRPRASSCSPGPPERPFLCFCCKSLQTEIDPLQCRSKDSQFVFHMYTPIAAQE